MIYDFAVSTRKAPGMASESEAWSVVGAVTMPKQSRQWIEQAAREMLEKSPEANAVAVFATRNGKHLGRIVAEVYRAS